MSLGKLAITEKTYLLDTFLDHINSDKLEAILNIQTMILLELQAFAVKSGFTQLMPILLSPITDPLNHDVYPAELQYEEKRLKLTASMIFHKQLSLIPNYMQRIFIMAPNIRLELAHKKSSQNHLLEFTQFDLEVKNANMYEIMDLVEQIYHHIFAKVNKHCLSELKILGRVLPKMDAAFPRYSTEGIPLDQVDVFCKKVSHETQLPAFITNFKREFYDKEDEVKAQVYRNFDIVYPEGFGEGLSGGEREHEYSQILRRMNELNMDLTPYQNYLEIAERKLLPKTAGCGIGIERLMKFICGENEIKQICLFDRSIKSDFAF